MTRRPTRTALALATLAAAWSVWAQDFNAPIELPRVDEPTLVDHLISQRGQDMLASLAVYGPDALNRGLDNAADRAARYAGPAADLAMQHTEAGQALQGTFDGLSDTDRQAQAAFDRDPGPSVPSSCLGDSACQACFGPAVERIDFNRYWLLRARILTVNTVKVGQAGLAMLDAVSGAAQAAGPVLQYRERPAIEARMSALRSKYEEKATTYLNGLDAGMRALGECEAQHFGTRDWYQRYGYLYMSFMRERYAQAPQ